MSKSGNLLYFNAKKNGPSFLITNARIAFNHLWLALTKAPILQIFDPKYYIWIETDVLSYAISGVLNQLAFENRPDGVVIRRIWASSIQ